MKTGKEKNFVSCVLYLHNNQESVRGFLEQLGQVMEENFEKYELVCVNDGCTDATLEEVRGWLESSETDHVVSLINLSYYQGMEAAMNAGRDIAVGDYLFEFDCVYMDFDPSLIMEVYKRALEGVDVVAAAPLHYVSFTSRLFYAVYNWRNPRRKKLRQERFRIVSRRAVNRVGQLNSYTPYRKALYLNCGLKVDTITYDNKTTRHPGHNKEEWGNRSVLAIDSLIIFTDVMERVSLLFSGLFLAILIFMFGYIIQSFFSAAKPVEGWLSLMSLMAMGFFMLFVMLTLIFKYLSLILNMSFKRQRYVIEGVEKLTR